MNSSGNIIIHVAIALIMLGIGFNIDFGALKKVFTKPKGILTGLSCQMILLPALAFSIAFIFPIEPIYKVGLVLLAACPGGTASNLVTHLLKGKVALSVSLTSFNSFLIIFSIPLLVSLALNTFMGKDADISLSLADAFKEVFLTVLIPTFLGMLVNHYYPDFISKMKKPLRVILPILLLVVFITAATDNSGEVNFQERLFNHLDLLLPSFLLNLVGIIIGYRIGRLVGITHGGSYTIAIEMGLQNSALAIFIATQLLDNNEIALMAIIYSSFTFFTTIGFAYMLKKHMTPSQLFRKGFLKNTEQKHK